MNLRVDFPQTVRGVRDGRVHEIAGFCSPDAIAPDLEEMWQAS